MARRHESKCLLLYVYSYCLGLGAVSIAVIFTWTEESPISTRALLAVSISLSLSVLVVQTLMTRVLAQTRTWVITRSVIIVVGLFLSAVLTGIATCLYTDVMALFFVCSLSSVGLHLVASIAHVVNICQKRNIFPRDRNSADAEDDTNRQELNTSPAIIPVSAFVSETLLVHPSLMTSPWQYFNRSDSEIPGRSCPDVNAARSELQLSLRQLLMMGVPSSAGLPTYADIFDTKPPEYSEVMTGLTNQGSRSFDPFNRQDEGNGSMPMGTEAPPNYEDICSDAIQNNLCLHETNDIGSDETNDIGSDERNDLHSDERNDLHSGERNAVCSDE